MRLKWRLSGGCAGGWLGVELEAELVVVVGMEVLGVVANHMTCFSIVFKDATIYLGFRALPGWEA